MGKAILFLLLAFALGAYGLNPTAALAQPPDGSSGEEDLGPSLAAGHVARYRLTYMSSQTVTSIRSLTVISITNHKTSGSCSTSVDWRFGFAGVACTTVLTLGPGQTGEHCSRSLPASPIAAGCNATCAPGLTSIEGSAVIGSTNSTSCALIAVDGRIFYTTGSDSGVAAISNPRIVRIGAANAGD